MTGISDEERVVKYDSSGFALGVQEMSMETTEHCWESKNVGWNASVPEAPQALLDP